MKTQEVILRAMAKKITWWQAAEILGISDRQMRRWKERYEEEGYDGLMDRRYAKPSVRRVPVATVEPVLSLCRERYFDFNVQHFHEKLEQASDPAELLLGEAGSAWSRAGRAGEKAGRTSETARAAAVTRAAAAHRREPSSVVSG